MVSIISRFSSEAKSGQPQLYFLGVEAGDFESANLIDDWGIGNDLAELLLEGLHVAVELPHHSDFTLATRSEIGVHWQVAGMGTTNLEW